ncbi:MAG: hypothetical protein CMI53_01910 [Parcubacteria group bacterium]|nr:hypothetical protein [Parcubacteria group bacterium]|tara:strand:+ start:2288 stop:2989 length:702 start_codon:yes stop_codon:yes gene_type:complete
MVGFKTKEISNPPSLGERLKNCRLETGISLAEVSKQTSISPKYLEAIEAGQFEKLPGEVYTKSFLKVYSTFLGENCDDYLAHYQSEQKVYNKTKKDSKNDFNKPVARISSFNLVVTPKIVRGIIIGLLALACLTYLGFKFKSIVREPTLIISSPANNFVTEENFIEVKGQTEPEVTLEINGQQILANDEGQFSEIIDLHAGSNIIELRAETRHGKETKEYIQVVVINQEGENN